MVIKEKMNISDIDLAGKYLPGNDEISIEKEVQIPENIINKFEEISGKENVCHTNDERANHAYGKSYPELLKLRLSKIENPPDLVIYPKSTDEVVEIVNICNTENIAIIPFGGGSSVTDALEAPKGGISLNLTRHMNKVLKVSEINSSVKVQAGMYGPDFEKYLNTFSSGYTCGHFPQSFEFSTVGGWIAARGAGTFSTAYGKIEEMVLALKVVSPAGSIETKDYPADAEAWDLNHIFIGSEGVLGVIVEATLKIRKYQANNAAYAAFLFKDFESAVNSMRQTMQAGYGKPHLFRISDPEETDVAFKMKGFDGTFSDSFLKLKGYKPGKRTLMFVVIEGDKDYAKFIKNKIKKTAKKNSGFFIGGKPTKKWLEQRYSSAYARDPLMDLGIITDTLETTATWENLLPLWEEMRAYLKNRPLTTVMVHLSHVYENGANLYITFLSPMKRGDELDDYYQLHKGLVDTIVKNKGSLSHHHGIGRALSPWMKQQYNETELGLYQAIKNKLDPNGIMNPGNMLGLG
ncbi:MAG: alkylglycerone-phosphate synthase [Bacteroidetes bacterium 4572_117]|nr:MAG: alkylglycerone-phosphate synthase [Bacteroidetes bacterium 4572_117]